LPDQWDTESVLYDYFNLINKKGIGTFLARQLLPQPGEMGLFSVVACCAAEGTFSKRRQDGLLANRT